MSKKKEDSTAMKVYKGVKTGVGVATMAVKAYKLATFLASVINPEVKWFSTQATITTTNFNNAGSVGLYSGMAQGNSENTRNGNSIRAKSFYAQITVSGQATKQNFGRIIIFRDYENRQALPAVGDVLYYSNVASHLNPYNSERFEILMDRRVHLDDGGGQTKTVKFFYKFNKRLKKGSNWRDPHLKYQGSGSGISFIDEGQIFVLFISNAATADAPQAQMITQLKYYDN